MGAALTITAKDLRQRFRDRSAIVLGFVAPVVIAALMSFAFSGTEHIHINLGVVNQDSSPVATGFVDALRSPDLHDVFTLHTYDSPEAAAAAVKARDVDTAIVVPAGFGAAATGNDPQPISVLTSADATLAGQVTRSIADAFVAQVNADRLSVATALAAGAGSDQIAQLAEKAATLQLPVQLRVQPSGSRELKAVSYFGPAMGIFFVFFAISFTARSWFIEEREGTLERMSAAVRLNRIRLGKAGAVLVYGLASLITMATFTSLLFGADWGGPLSGGALCVAMVLAIVSLTALVTVVARTERQAEGISSILTFGLCLLGGNFLFVSAAPALLRKLALFTPNGWALRGFVDVSTGSHSLSTVATPVAMMLAFTAVVTVLTVVLSRLQEAS